MAYPCTFEYEQELSDAHTIKTMLHPQAELALSRELLATNMQTAGFEKLVWRSAAEDMLAIHGTQILC